jgi:hypothetical protein
MIRSHFLASPYALRNARDTFPAWAEKHAQAVAPEIRPFYFVPARIGPHVVGLSGANLDTVYEDEIGLRYEGRGAAEVVDLEYLWSEFLDGWNLDYGAHPFINQVLALHIHELAHICERDQLHGNGTAETSGPVVREFLATPFAETKEAAVPWRDHDAHWIRLVVHLLYRTEIALGFSLWHLNDHITSFGYGPSDLAEYRTALADEPRRLAGETFAQIRATCPPQAFIDLWRNDVARWFDTLDSPTPEQARAALQGLDLFSHLRGVLVMNWMEQATAVKERRQAERLAAVDDLARRQAAGENLSPETIVESIEAAGVSLEDYSAKLTHIAKRRPLLAGLAEKPDVERRLAGATQQMQAAAAALEVAQAVYSQAYHPAEFDHRQASERLGQIETGRQKSRNECKCPAIVAGLARVRGELGPARNRRDALTNRQRDLRQMIAVYESQLSAYAEVLVPVNSGTQSWRGGEMTKGNMTADESRQTRQALDNVRAEFDRNAGEIAELAPRVEALQREEVELLSAAERSDV